MALKIRLRQQGRTNRQTYRLVVTDVRNPRDGKYLEMLGWYNPFSNDKNCHVHADRIQYWVSQGAQISECAETLIKKVAPHVMKEIRESQQKKRVKEAAKRRAGKKGTEVKAGSSAKPAAVKAEPKPKKEATASKEPKAAKPKAPRAKKAQDKE